MGGAGSRDFRRSCTAFDTCLGNSLGSMLIEPFGRGSELMMMCPSIMGGKGLGKHRWEKKQGDPFDFDRVVTNDRAERGAVGIGGQ